MVLARRAGIVVLLLLAGCTGAERDGRSPAMPAPPGAYPDLARVPERPRLGYSVDQRRAIASALVADRANARYRAAGLAFATGQAKTPPAPPAGAPPPPAPAAAPATPPAGDASLAQAYVEANLNAASDEGDLGDFVKRLDRDVPDPAGPRSVAQLVGVAAAPAAPAEPVDATPAPQGMGGFSNFLGGLLGVQDRPPAGRP